MNELHKWKTEERLVSAALLTAGEHGAAAVFVKGDIVDTSGLRLRIVGWGRASFLLVGANFNPNVSDGILESIVELQGNSPINWAEAILLEFPNGNVLAVWSD